MVVVVLPWYSSCGITMVVVLSRDIYIPHRGIEQVLTMRLKHRLRHDVIRSDPSPPWDLLSQVEKNPYGLDYLCILDFEATCEARNPPNYVHEIIEFPVLLLNLKTLEVVSQKSVNNLSKRDDTYIVGTRVTSFTYSLCLHSTHVLLA